ALRPHSPEWRVDQSVNDSLRRSVYCRQRLHMTGLVYGTLPQATYFAADFMQQFLYFLPLPHGHGSLRPTLSILLRSGWTFFPSPRAFVCWARTSSAAARARGASAWVAALISQTDSWKLSSSSSLKTASVTFSATPSHIVSNSFMPCRLYS